MGVKSVIRKILTMNKARYMLAVVMLSLFLVGTMFGVLIENYHIPDRFVQKCRLTPVTYFQANDITEKGGGKVTIITRTLAPLQDRPVEDPGEGGNPSVLIEEDAGYIYHSRSLEINKTAVIIIDARTYSYFPDKGWLKRVKENMRLKLAPFYFGWQENIIW